MFKDDDEEEENTFGVTRYPCMPSLVALQQMRNRLHLAFLGRKLMKWTALATGREMRRLASELYDVYQGFGEDMRNAFIMLARGRYFVPQLNSIVTEDINKKAGVVVQQSSKAVSGVKIVQFEIFETDSPPYPHLGIEKGGQAILEAKKAWLDLLKRLIMMMQLRASFLMVELANKNATKKWNVLSKLVVPRLNLSCHYILSELEEIEREDNFRLKRFKELKVKKAKGKEDSIIRNETCECIDFETKELVDECREPPCLVSKSETSSKIEEESIEEEEQYEPNTDFDETESNITEYQFKDTKGENNPSLAQSKDKEEKKMCLNCKNIVKQEKINIYEENNCPNCKNNEAPKNFKELVKKEEVSKEDNLCPSCKKRKGIEFIDKKKISQTKMSHDDNLCSNCKRKGIEFIDPREMPSQINKVCPSCIKNDGNEINEVKRKKIYKQDFMNNKCINSNLNRVEQNLCPSCKKLNIKKSETELDPQKVFLKLETSKSLDNNTTEGKIKNICPLCKNNNLKSSRSIDFNQNNFLPLTDENRKSKLDTLSQDKHLCPSCINTKQNKAIDKNSCIACKIEKDKSTKSANNKYIMKNHTDNKVCPGCSLTNNDRTCLNKTKKKERRENENDALQRDSKEKEKTKYCPACKSSAMKNYHICDCNNTSDIKIVKSDEYNKTISEACSLCEKMRLTKTIPPSFSCNSNLTNKQTQQTCTDDTSEIVESINEIFKFKRLSDSDGIITEEIMIKTRRTRKNILRSSSDTVQYIKKAVEKPEKCIKQTKSENINQSKVKNCSSISSLPTKASCLSSCSIPKSEIQSKSNFGESVPLSSQNINSSQFNKICLKNRYESDNESITNCMICQNTKTTKSNASLIKSRKTSECSKDMTKVKSDYNSCCKIKIINKDKNSEENSDEEEIELTPSTIVILKKILSCTNRSVASCSRSIETDNKNTQKSNPRSKTENSSYINSVKSEPCMQKKIKETFDNKLGKTEPACNTCVMKDFSKSEEDTVKKERISPLCSNKNFKPETLKINPSMKGKQPNIVSRPEPDNKINICKQYCQETIEQKTANATIDNNSCHESYETKESKDNSSGIKDKEQASKYVCNKTTSCENKSCQTREQHHSHERKEKSDSNNSIKTKSKCPHIESCCTCKKKLENEVKKTCTCSKTKPISHTVKKTCTCTKAKPKSSKIVIKVSEGNCSCNKQASDLVHNMSSSKQSNRSVSCTGSVETLSIANQTCLMDRLSDNASKKTDCLCLKNSNLKGVTRESEEKLSCSMSKIAVQKNNSDHCVCKKNTSENVSRLIEKKCSDSNKSLTSEYSCVSGKSTKKNKEKHPCACHQANNIHKSKEPEIKKGCQCQKPVNSKTSICSCIQLKFSNSDNTKKKPKCSCKSSSKKSIHRIENKDSVCSGRQMCSKCLSSDRDLPLANEICSCTKHKPRHDEHKTMKDTECSCTSTKTDLTDTVNSSETCNCQVVKTPPPSYTQESCKTSDSDIKKTHSCTCKKTSELKQKCTCSQTKDTSQDHSQSNEISSKTCKDAPQSQSKKSNYDRSRECSCRSSQNTIDANSEKSFDSFQSLVKTPCSCRKHNLHKTNEKPHDITIKKEATSCSCYAADQKSGSCAKHQTNISTDTQYSRGPSENSFKPNVSFESKIGKPVLTGSNKSQCTCESKKNEENLKQTCKICKKEISKPCSCKEIKPKMTKICTTEAAASSTCPCESSKHSLSIASNKSTQSISVGSQTCSGCASIQLSQKSIRFSNDASPTRTIKSDSSLPTESSCSMKSRLSSQSQSSKCSCGKKDVSTSTKRSDRYDVRTLRHLPVEPKKLDCPCQSDSAVLKIKKPRKLNTVGKCCSLHDSYYFRY